jgi:hypothetical protein
MAIIALNHPLPFPVARLRRGLSAHLRHFRWQCGDDDLGGAEDTSTFDRPQLISGRNADEIIYVPLERRTSDLPGNPPPHNYHIAIGNPTAEDADIALQIRIILCAGLMQQHQEDCWCQLETGGPWIDREAMIGAISLLDDGIAAGQLVAQLVEAAAEPQFAQPDLFASLTPERAQPAVPAPQPDQLVLATPSTEFESEPEPDAMPAISPLAFGRKGAAAFGRKGL